LTATVVAVLGMQVVLIPAALADSRGTQPLRSSIGQAADGSPTTESMTITSQARASAGEFVQVLINGVVGDGVVSLTAISSLGATEQHAATVSGSAQFTLGEDVTRTSGEITLLARAADAVATASVIIEPGPAVGPITSVVGARSIVADAADRSMAVSMPPDTFGNTIADGSSLLLFRQHPDGTVTNGPVTVTHLLAWDVLPSGTRAGSNQIWFQADTVTGPAATLDEVAAAPMPFTLAPVDPQQVTPGADGQGLLAVRTSVLADGNGNVEPDGTQVTFDWRGPEGPSRTHAVTIAGVASMTIPAPVVPAVLTITGSCRGSVTTTTLTVEFASAVATVPVTAVRGADSMDVSVGPVLRAGGAYVPDGTVADVTVTDPAGDRLTASGPLVDGMLRLPVSGHTEPGLVTVVAQVLGTFGNVVVP
jgi:hypothetical protein